MFIPGFISVLLVIVVSILTYWMNQRGLNEKEFLSLAISAWASAGALISATFVVYGYLLNVRAFAEANKPKLLVFVENAQATLIPTGKDVHQTRICYRNVGSVEAENFSLFAQLVGNNEVLEIPRLFDEVIDLQIGDSRVRDFPTERYLRDNGIPKAVVQNLEKYRLRVGYSVRSLVLQLQIIAERHGYHGPYCPLSSHPVMILGDALMPPTPEGPMQGDLKSSSSPGNGSETQPSPHLGQGESHGPCPPRLSNRLFFNWRRRNVTSKA